MKAFIGDWKGVGIEKVYLFHKGIVIFVKREPYQFGQDRLDRVLNCQSPTHPHDLPPHLQSSSLQYFAPRIKSENLGFLKLPSLKFNNCKYIPRRPRLLKIAALQIHQEYS